MKLRLPPGQRKANRFPILQAGDIPKIKKENWILEIYGEVEHPTTFNYKEFINLPTIKIKADIHCVTTWSLYDTEWEGVLFTEIFKIVKPKSKAKFIIFECADLGATFTTSLPMEIAVDENAIMAFKYDGKELESNHGGPVRGLVPKKYFYKSAKWVQKLRFVEKDELGYWEQRGYSNSADPWKEERYS